MAQPKGTVRKPLYDRFREKVKFAGPNECWEWQAQRTAQGYGRLNGGTQAPGEQLAHRIAWILYMGLIPDEIGVCHHCDNPPCVNPLHLFLGTNQDNVTDRVRKGREADRRGIHNPAATITEDTVREIRRIYADGGVTQTALGVRFGISQHVVSRVVTGKTWSHVL